MDIVSKFKRSEIMAKVSSKDTKPEVLVRKYLFSKGFRYRKNVKELTGKPDIVLSKYKTIIFIYGCFWHGHRKCKAAELPTSNVEYWTNKISSNITRDIQHREKLELLGWKVITIWECELKAKNRKERLELLLYEINN